MESHGVVIDRPPQKDNGIISLFKRISNPVPGQRRTGVQVLSEKTAAADRKYFLSDRMGLERPVQERQFNPEWVAAGEKVLDTASDVVETGLKAAKKGGLAATITGTLMLPMKPDIRPPQSFARTGMSQHFEAHDPKVIMGVQSVTPLPDTSENIGEKLVETPPLPAITQENKVEVADVRLQIIDKLLPGLSDADKVIVSNAIDHELETRSLPNVGKAVDEYGPYINMEADEYKIPDYVIFGMLGAESRFDPTVKSETGAMGIAQFATPAATEVGIYNDERGMDLRDFPPAAIKGLAEYVAKYKKYFGNNLGFGIQNYTTGAGFLSEYTKAVTGVSDVNSAARETNAYHVIQNVSPKNPDDKLYLIRVMAHAEEYLKFKQKVISSH